MKGGITLTEGKKEEEKIQDCLKKKRCVGRNVEFGSTGDKIIVFQTWLLRESCCLKGVRWGDFFKKGKDCV